MEQIALHRGSADCQNLLIEGVADEASPLYKKLLYPFSRGRFAQALAEERVTFLPFSRCDVLIFRIDQQTLNTVP